MNSGGTVGEQRTSFVKTIQAAIIEASQDYFRWSNGKILYETAAESLLPCYAARHLFEAFQTCPGIVIEIEPALKDLGFDEGGRFDLTARLSTGQNFAVEFKRYSNPAERNKDLDRLRRTVCRQSGWIGLFAAPDYDRVPGTERLDRPGTDEIWHRSGPFASLPAGPLRPDGRTHVCALVIELNNETDSGGDEPPQISPDTYSR